MRGDLRVTQQIVLISGKQGSGKTTAANQLAKQIRNHEKWYFHIMTFAEPIYQMHNYCRGILADAGIDVKHPVKDGNLLQLLGTEWARKTIDENVWVNTLRGRINKLLVMRNYGEERVTFIVADCRFRNEFDAYPEALRVRLRCPEEERKKRAEMWRENTNHPSETDLDEYDSLGLFDMYFDTDKVAPEHIARMVSEELLKSKWTEKRVKDAAAT